MALNFKGETTTAVLNNTENIYKKDDLFRLYDAGILKLGNIVCEHGDFVSWTGTAWKLEKGAGYAVETSGGDDSLENRVNAIEEKIPEDASEDNKLVTIADLVALEEELLSTNPPATNTLRFSFSKKDYDPTAAGVGASGTWKKLTKYSNVWDWTADSNSFKESFFDAFNSADNDVYVIAAGDCSAVTNMYRMFRGCTYLRACCLFDTSSVTTMAAAFFNCTRLKEIPQFNTSSVTIAEYAFNQCRSIKVVPLLDTSAMTNVDSIFSGCANVESGALALYTQMSTQATPPITHPNAFSGCGSNTTTGAAELAQIPASWGGTAAS